MSAGISVNSCNNCVIDSHLERYAAASIKGRTSGNAAARSVTASATLRPSQIASPGQRII